VHINHWTVSLDPCRFRNYTTEDHKIKFRQLFVCTWNFLINHNKSIQKCRLEPGNHVYLVPPIKLGIWRLGFDFRGRQGLFFWPLSPNRSWGPPSLQCNGHRGLSPGVKRGVVKLTTHQLIPSLRMRGAIPPFHIRRHGVRLVRAVECLVFVSSRLRVSARIEYSFSSFLQSLN
jgi:hypothetical protein